MPETLLLQGLGQKQGLGQLFRRMSKLAWGTPHGCGRLSASGTGATPPLELEPSGLDAHTLCLGTGHVADARAASLVWLLTHEWSMPVLARRVHVILCTVSSWHTTQRHAVQAWLASVLLKPPFPRRYASMQFAESGNGLPPRRWQY